MKFDELVETTGIAARQLRYLIAEGFVPPPTGGRTYASYGDDHVSAVRRYERLRSLGFPPAAIKLLLGAREGVPVPIAPGITLVIEPELIGSNMDARAVSALAADKITALLAGETPRGAAG